MPSGDDLRPSTSPVAVARRAPAPAPAPPRVVTPMLAIFPGTTAAHAALEFMSHARELSDGDRGRIALVYIDIDSPPPDLVAFRAQHAGLFNEHVLRIAVPPHIARIPRTTQDGSPAEPHTYIGEKRPEAFENGAAGIRNNGHVAFCHDYRAITDTLVRALEQITSREANSERGEPSAVQINVAAFIGGGTASGILGDLACLAKLVADRKSLGRRLNLTCILPADVSDSSDIDVRRSNAVACLMEVLALSLAKGAAGRPYRKYVRDSWQDLPGLPIANEVYLVGSAGLTDTREIARIAGLDLYQRTLDASGVGALERSRSADRISLGDYDDRDLPTMFGMSCPLEVRFPARETATAFAQVTAAQVLPMLAGHSPRPPEPDDEQREDWLRKWRAGCPPAVQALSLTDFEDVSSDHLDRLWTDVERWRRETAGGIDAALASLRAVELERIEAADLRTPAARIARWQELLGEYRTAREDLDGQGVPEVVPRPADLERKSLGRLGRLRSGGRADALRAAYGACLESHARNHRHVRMRELLAELERHAGARLEAVSAWARRANAAGRAPALEERGRASAAWNGRLERRHPFQIHLLDLQTLRDQRGASQAVERLYRWATATIGGSRTGEPDYDALVDPCVSEIASLDQADRLQHQSAERLADAVVGHLERRYLELFQAEGSNLFGLLRQALPDEDGGNGDLLRTVLEKQLARLQSQMTDLVKFDERLGGDRCVNALKREVFLGFHWRDGREEELLKGIAIDLKLNAGNAYECEPDLDPHRVQVSYMRHAISLSTIYDFFSDSSSAMEQYRRQQGAWERQHRKGGRPPHSCDALESLTLDLRLEARLLRPPTSTSAASEPGPGPAPSA